MFEAEEQRWSLTLHVQAVYHIVTVETVSSGNDNHFIVMRK